MTLTFSKVVSIQVDLDEITDKQAEVWMKDVEEKLFNAFRERGREMIEEAFQSIINSKAPDRGIKEWVGKWVRTIWGEIRLLFPRPRNGAFPKLRIPSSTPGVSSLILEMCARKPFRQSERIIKETRGLRIPRSTLWKHFQDQAEALPELPDVEPQPAEAVVISADGTVSKAEAKIALAFTDRKDHTLLNKVVYASTEPSETFNAKASELRWRKYSVEVFHRDRQLGALQGPHHRLIGMPFGIGFCSSREGGTSSPAS